MELKIIEDTKNKMIFELKGEDHTLCNALVKELWNDSHIKAAGYNIAHPLVGVPRMVVETDTSSNPRKALIDAAKRIKKTNNEFRKKITKELK